MKLLNESWTILQEADGPAKVVFGDKQLNDPSGISLRGMAKQATEKKAADEAAAALERKRKENAEKYAAVLDAAKKSDDPLETLFDELVPESGMADTVAGEIVRALMRILYRDSNDGDKFYEGYGLETAGPSAAYLMSVDELEDIDVYGDLTDIAETAMKYEPEYDFDDEYTEALEKITKKITDYILTHPELLSEPNKTDSRDFSTSVLEDYIPKYDYEFEISDEVKEYMKAGEISRDDVLAEVKSWLDNDISFRDADVDFQYSDYIVVSNLSREGYEGLKQWEEHGLWDDYIEYLEEEYGSPEDAE